MTRKVRSGMNLVELLVVMGIVAILLSLLLPAVQKVRESAAKVKCANNLKQMGLGLHLYHELWERFPSGGTTFGPPPTYITPAFPALPPVQNAGWPFQILPHIEQMNPYSCQAQVMVTPISIYFCPSRRSNMVTNGGQGMRAMIDYSSATGPGGDALGSGPYYGVIVKNPNMVRALDVTDGLSNTFVLGEKRLNPEQYSTGALWDDEGFTDGWDNDIVCLTNYPFGKDTPGAVTGLGHQFGSAHPYGMNSLFGDGSVKMIPYTTPTATLNSLGDRRDGAMVNLD